MGNSIHLKNNCLKYKDTPSNMPSLKTWITKFLYIFFFVQSAKVASIVNNGNSSKVRRMQKHIGHSIFPTTILFLPFNSHSSSLKKSRHPPPWTQPDRAWGSCGDGRECVWPIKPPCATFTGPLGRNARDLYTPPGGTTLEGEGRWRRFVTPCWVSEGKR